jgi:hypothetical protein
MIEMDVGDQRGWSFFSDFPEGMSRFHVWDSQTDDFTPRVGKAVDLPHGGPNIPRVRVRHGLDRNGRIPSNGNMSHMDDPSFSSSIGMRCFLMIHS